MPINIKTFFFSAAFVFMLSCTNHQEVEPASIFSDSASIAGNVLNVESKQLGEPIQSLLFDDTLLVVNDLKSTDYKFHIINIKTKAEIKSFAKKGKGPCEVKFALGFNMNPNASRSFNTYDRLNKKYISYNIDSVLLRNNDCKQLLIQKFSNDFLAPVLLQNNRFIATGPFEEGRYRISDTALSNHEYKYDYPLDPDKSEVSRPSKSMVYQGNFALQPQGNHFAFAAGRCGLVEFFKTKKGTVKKVKDHHFYNPDYKAETETQVGITGENKAGFSDMSATNQYLYVLYSGRTFSDYRMKLQYGKHILVFNWEGEPIKHYKLDKAVRCISVNKTDGMLYGWAALPEPALLEYTLNH